jgi:hypothetical protein
MAFELSKPALLAAVAYLVLAFAILLPLDNRKSCDPAADPTCYNFGRRFLTLILMLIPIGLSIYSINCMTVGKCTVWSWVNSVLIALWVLLFLVAIVTSQENQVGLAQQQQQSVVMVRYTSE